MKVLRIVELILGIVWALSCVSAIVFAICHLSNLSNVSIATMWISLIIKTILSVILISKGGDQS